MFCGQSGTNKSDSAQLYSNCGRALATGPADCARAHLMNATLAARLRSGSRFTYTPVFGDHQAHSMVLPEAPSEDYTFPGALGYTVNADLVVCGNTEQRNSYVDRTGFGRCEVACEASADIFPSE